MAKLRTIIRVDDEVIRVQACRCGVLGRFSFEHAESVAKRVSAELMRAALPVASGISVKWPVHMGVACHPEHGNRAADLIEQAQAALEQARAAGAGRYHIPPMPPPDTESSTDDKPTSKQDAQTSALLDELTGILRADRLGTAMQKFMARHRREGRPASVICLSVDFFHQYRDHYNAATADRLIKDVADLLSRRTRETDILARTDESGYAVVMDCAPAHALAAAQRIVSEIKKTPFRSGAASLRITASAGVAGYPDQEGQAADMLTFAEAAMMSARAQGRSVCLLYRPEMQPRRQDDRPVDIF